MDIKKMLPFLEDEELKELALKIVASPEDSYQGVSLSQVLPFLDEDDVDDIMLEEAKKKGTCPSCFFPFASDEGLDALVDYFIHADKEPESLQSLLPFAEDEAISKIAAKVSANGGHWAGITTNKLYPFMDDDDLDDAFIKAVERGDPSAKDMAVFASEDAYHHLTEEYLSGKLKDFDIDSYYTFMDDDDIRAVFRKALKN
jgi:hypothetical protein